jgi:hypothetical protein
MQDYISDFLGVKTATLIAAFLGSVLSLSYIPQLTRAQVFSSVATGVAIAAYGAPMAISGFGLPEVLERGVAFFAALLAMRLVPVMFFLVDRLKNVKIPFLPDTKE